MTPGSVPDPILAQLAGRERHSTRDQLVRLAVRLRAADACEYCLLPTLGRFQIDHIIPPTRWSEYVAGRIRGVAPTLPRRGPDHLDNYAWTCPFCNAAKSHRVVGRAGGRSSRLFDPRHDRWIDHFGFVHRYLFVVGISSIGSATVEALNMNGPGLDGPLGLRHEAIMTGDYPPRWARVPLAGPE